MIDDQDLVKAMVEAQSGCERSYQKLLTEVAKLLRGYVKNHVYSEEAQEDLVQEILLSVHHARHSYDGKRPFKPWLYAIAKYRLYDYLRKHYRKGEVGEDYKVEHREEVSLSIDGHIEAAEELEKLLKNIPEKQKEMLMLMKVEGYTAKEIASKYNMKESEVKVSVRRTLKHLKKQYEGLR